MSTVKSFTMLANSYALSRGVSKTKPIGILGVNSPETRTAAQTAYKSAQLFVVCRCAASQARAKSRRNPACNHTSRILQRSSASDPRWESNAPRKLILCNRQMAGLPHHWKHRIEQPDWPVKSISSDDLRLIAGQIGQSGEVFWRGERRPKCLLWTDQAPRSCKRAKNKNHMCEQLTAYHLQTARNPQRKAASSSSVGKSLATEIWKLKTAKTTTHKLRGPNYFTKCCQRTL